MKVALVCDWLTSIGGAEKVLLELHHLFPDAPIYTSQYAPKGITWFHDADVRTGWLQIFPSKMRRLLGPLRQIYFNHLDLSNYDLIISVTGAEAKGVKKGKALHLCYCHVPTQYYWQMQDDYLKNPGFGIFNPLVRVFYKLLIGPLRNADYKAAQKPDYFITISQYAKKQIMSAYNRDSIIIHPPVEIDDFTNVKSESLGYYIVTARQVNWKRLDLCVKACLELKRPLMIIGDGPEHKKLKKIADESDLIRFFSFMPKEKLKTYLATAKAYLFPSIEPFGIAPVEALAAGCPVIALSQGGSQDFIKDGKNGVFFAEQTIDSLKDAILRFEELELNRQAISTSVKNFGLNRFDKEIQRFINEKTR